MNSSFYLAFLGSQQLAEGTWDEVVAAARPHHDHSQGPLLIFDRGTGRQRDFDARPNASEPTKPGPGRPKLGVVSTEVTLLPRHWEWLAAQPARASGTLRRLVEEAMAIEAHQPRRRLEALGNVLWSLAGNLPGFEEATRALYAGDRAKLAEISSQWPGDLPRLVSQWT